MIKADHIPEALMLLMAPGQKSISGEITMPANEK